MIITNIHLERLMAIEKAYNKIINFCTDNIASEIDHFTMNHFTMNEELIEAISKEKHDYIESIKREFKINDLLVIEKFKIFEKYRHDEILNLRTENIMKYIAESDDIVTQESKGAFDIKYFNDIMLVKNIKAYYAKI